MSSETSSIKEAATEDDASEWLATQFYDLHAEDPRQWQPTDAALQDGAWGSPSSFTGEIVHDGSVVITKLVHEAGRLMLPGD